MAKINHKVTITPFLWFENQAEEAAKFYCTVFKNAVILQSSPMIVTCQLEGQKIMLLNGGPYFKLSEAFSFFIECNTQEEVDYYWEKLSEGGEKSQCGWVKDKFGVSWQVVPHILGVLMSDPDQAKVKRVSEAMLKMKKLEIDTLLKASEN